MGFFHKHIRAWTTFLGGGQVMHKVFKFVTGYYHSRCIHHCHYYQLLTKTEAKINPWYFALAATTHSPVLAMWCTCATRQTGTVTLDISKDFSRQGFMTLEIKMMRFMGRRMKWALWTIFREIYLANMTSATLNGLTMMTVCSSLSRL